jgi:hypothetical protein
VADEIESFPSSISLPCDGLLVDWRARASCIMGLGTICRVVGNWLCGAPSRTQTAGERAAHKGVEKQFISSGKRKISNPAFR